MFDSFASNSRFDFVGKWYDTATGRDKWIEIEASTTASTWNDDEAGGGDYLVTYIYQVNGKYYDGSFRSETPVDIGAPFSVRYKPSNPKRNYLSGLHSGREPLVLIVIAAGFGLFWLILHMMSRGYY
jgi:Protein of unknown function (DUF3592)